MPITSNLDELIARFQRLATAAETLDVTAALTIGVNTARAKMTNRIFNQGLDSEMKSLGKYTGKKSRITDRRYTRTSEMTDSDDPYSAKAKKLGKKKLARLKKNAVQQEDDQFSEYEKERLAHGRQINYKDLEFTGGTRRAFKTQLIGNGVFCVIDNPENAKIMQYQEEQIGKIRGGGRVKIAALSEDERELMEQETNAALGQIYDRLLNA